MDDDPRYDHLSIHDLVGGDRTAENIENNPWVHEWRRVLAVADRVEDRVEDRDLRQAIIDDFVKLFKADEARRYSALK
jgi:hypothetical protein